ncbi:POU domain, class 6, transcription factor 2 [Melipona quadrifasciata]|uniref:POU domain, class 6, transcription factor 2 n=1 Tax=Melipona quadrifasciata TaxID=166423 RepID=A0A0N1IT93_9HYME|nr:POU domain, class 6, transcription factor 2 [Melipona quadrifasciata]
MSQIDYESPGCKADMAEGSAEEEQSSTAAPASPPADLRTLNTQLSPPYHHQSHLQPRLQHLQHPNMLATAVPPRHSHSMLSHQVKTEAELDAPCDVPLNLKSETELWVDRSQSLDEERKVGGSLNSVSSNAILFRIFNSELSRPLGHGLGDRDNRATFQGAIFRETSRIDENLQTDLLAEIEKQDTCGRRKPTVNQKLDDSQEDSTEEHTSSKSKTEKCMRERFLKHNEKIMFELKFIKLVSSYILLNVYTISASRAVFHCNEQRVAGWEPIFPRGWNKVEGEAEEGVVVSSVSACGRWGGCGQSRGRMGWDRRTRWRYLLMENVVRVVGWSDRFAGALKVTRLSNLPVHSKLPSSWRNRLRLALTTEFVEHFANDEPLRCRSKKKTDSVNASIAAGISRKVTPILQKSQNSKRNEERECRLLVEFALRRGSNVGTEVRITGRGERSCRDGRDAGIVAGSVGHQRPLLLRRLFEIFRVLLSDEQRSSGKYEDDYDEPRCKVQKSMVTLQNLQNLANLQNLPQVASLAAGLQGMTAGLTNNQLINTPLNLTVSSSGRDTTANDFSRSGGTVPTASNTTAAPHLLPPSSTPMATLPQLLSQPQPVAMPQFILTSGQLVQGIQGAQLLIPTSQVNIFEARLELRRKDGDLAAEKIEQGRLNIISLQVRLCQAFNAPAILVEKLKNLEKGKGHECKLTLPQNVKLLWLFGIRDLLSLAIGTNTGIATQTILTIPVSHVTNNQMVNLALSNGQVVSTTLANLQSIAQPQNMLNTPTSNGEFTEMVFCCRATVPTSPSLASGLGLSPAALPHLLSNSSASQQLLSAMQPQQLLQAAQAAQAQAAQAVQAAQASQQPLLTTSPQHHAHRHLNHYTPTEKHHRERPEQSSPLNESVVSAASALNRLAASNGEITITTTHGPSGAGVKASPSSMHNPKKEEEDLNDSPNQPTINEATNNVVDGINLDEIKEFAKVFKFRRLSLGLTQTQVGQALSVTEGPAYSQSAICRSSGLKGTLFINAVESRVLLFRPTSELSRSLDHALATQMYAASQIASQQQATFEKLDITPKSAQKIKPVLERWMKEAEESHHQTISFFFFLKRKNIQLEVDFKVTGLETAREREHKSGLHQLTDFIGVETNKKRKRRTSFTPQALELLNAHFDRNTHPNGNEITNLAQRLGYDREVIRIWFCNKRQSLKNASIEKKKKREKQESHEGNEDEEEEEREEEKEDEEEEEEQEEEDGNFVAINRVLFSGCRVKFENTNFEEFEFPTADKVGKRRYIADE